MPVQVRPGASLRILLFKGIDILLDNVMKNVFSTPANRSNSKEEISSFLTLPPKYEEEPIFFILDAQPEAEFAQLLGMLTMRWNQLEYMIRLCTHRVDRHQQNWPEKERDKDLVNKMEYPKTAPKIAKALEDAITSSLLSDDKKALAHNTIRQMNMGSRHDENTLYGQRCKYEHSYLGITTDNRYLYLRVGNKSEPILYSSQQLEDLKIELSKFIETVFLHSLDLNQNIPSKL